MRAGIEKFGVRWNTVSCEAWLAMIGIDWMPDDPGADHGDALAGEVHTLVGPTAREVHVAAEPFGTVDVGRLRQ